MPTGTRVAVGAGRSSPYNHTTGSQTLHGGQPHLRRTRRTERHIRFRGGHLRRVHRPARGAAPAVRRPAHDVRDPAGHRRAGHLRAGHRPRRVDDPADHHHRLGRDALRRAHGVARAPGPGASRAPRQGARRPRGRLRPGARRIAARRAHRPRQPPGLPGGARAPVGGVHPPWDAARAGRRGPRRLPAHQRAGGPRRRRPAAGRGGRHAHRRTAPLRSHLPDRRRRVRRPDARIGRRGRLPLPAPRPRHGARGPRRPRAPGRRQRRRPVVVHGRGGVHPRHGSRPGDAVPRGRRRADVRQAPRPDRRDDLRSGAPRQLGPPATDRRGRRGGRQGGCGRGRARGVPAHLRPADGSAAWL